MVCFLCNFTNKGPSLSVTSHLGGGIKHVGCVGAGGWVLTVPGVGMGAAVSVRSFAVPPVRASPTSSAAISKLAKKFDAFIIFPVSFSFRHYAQATA